MSSAHESSFFVLQDMLLLAAMGPPGGGRMVISKRLQSRFNQINMTFPQVCHLTIKFSICCHECDLNVQKGLELVL